MATINWITPTGSIGNIVVNTPVSIKLSAYDSSNYGAVLTYKVIGGSLPAGMSLSTFNTGTNIGTDNNPIWSGEWVGMLTGTPTASAYDVDLIYNFVVRVTSNTSAIPLDAAFNITLVNIANNGFNWVTPAGSLGTVPAGNYYSLQLLTETAGTVSYKLISGEMPVGMRINPHGYIQGVPTFLSSVVTDQSQDFRFTVRATNSVGQINDRSFNLTVTSVAGPVIEPTKTLLGSFFDGTYFTQQLLVAELNPLAQIQWSIKDGQLPLGLTLDASGLISGYLQPLQLTGKYGPTGYDGDKTNDVGFSATMSGCTIKRNTLLIGSVDSGKVLVGMTLTGAGLLPGTQIIAAITEWNRGNAYGPGEVVIYNGSYYKSNSAIPANTDFNTRLWDATDNIVNAWKIFPPQTIADPIVINGSVDNILVSQEYDYGPYDFNEISQSASYGFTIQAFDGANYDLQTYVIEVISRSDFTADTSDSVNNTYLTVDANTTSVPVLLNKSLTLPTARQGAYYAFKFEGFDFSGDTIKYSISNTYGTFDAFVSGSDAGFDYNGGGTGGANSSEDPITDTTTGRFGVGFDVGPPAGAGSNLPGLILDAATGWLYGQITPTNLSLENFVIGVIVSKTANGILYSSIPTYFTLPILGNVNNIVEWITPGNLGLVNNGSVSELSVVAQSTIGKDLVYTLYDYPGVPCGLPQGITLLPSGELSGRVSFEAFSLDKSTTTFDAGILTIDRKYTFTVNAATADGTANAFREFTIAINVIDIDPYDNLYLKAMPSIDQRRQFNSLVSDTNIFDKKEIYRPNDPWFGVAKSMEMLFLAGLTPSTIKDFESAMIHNHWTKKYNFGDIKTAVVLDELYNVKYEVVYIGITDPEETAAGVGPGLELNLAGYIKNPYIDATGNTYNVVYPNTTSNMIKRLENAIGFNDQSSLPPWMTSNQPDAASVNKFQPPLGYTKAVVLAYTTPGASKSIAYRLKNQMFNFDNIEFAVAGYQLDNYYSTNYDLTTRNYTSGRETTFDYLATKNIGSIIARVNYGVDKPFSEINGRSVDYINAHGGIDGDLHFTDGETIIFITQENFSISVPYEGWVNYADAYIGDNITTAVVEGYDSEAYDRYSLIPGYLESIQLHITNQRGSIWQINIVNGTVSLTSMLPVNLNDRVQILNGKTHSASIYYYSPADVIGHTVPYYKVYNITKSAIRPPTTFNKGTTRFFSKRDQYYTPNSQDKYLKFPQYGVFN